MHCPIVLLFGCSDGECELTLSEELGARAGPGAINCGQVTLGADPAAVDACVRAAFSGAQHFYAEYEVQGIDSRLVRGVVASGRGEVILLSWDDYGGASATAVSAMRCVEPDVDSSPTRDASKGAPLTCTSTLPVERVC